MYLSVGHESYKKYVFDWINFVSFIAIYFIVNTCLTILLKKISNIDMLIIYEAIIKYKIK